MNRKDILIVTRYFWPQCGLTELALSDLALNLKTAGHDVTIATVRWSKNWSENIEYHGIPIVRFAKPVNGPWSSYRYARLLAKHLATKTYDAVIVSGVGDEAAATIRCFDEETPVIIRVDNCTLGSYGSLHRKHVECCLGADAVIADSPSIAEQFNRVEEMPRVHVVPDGIRSRRVKTDSVGKRQIREAMTAAHPVLQIDHDQPLAISFVPFEAGSGLLELVKCWSQVNKRLPRAKLWLLGDGSQSSTIWERIVRLDLAHAIVLPGYFDNMDDLFAAADLYIHPASHGCSSAGLIRAMMSGMEAVSTSVSELQDFFEVDPQCQLGNPANWSKIILSHLVDREVGTQRIKLDAIREKLTQHYCSQIQVEQYLSLIESRITDQVAVAK